MGAVAKAKRKAAPRRPLTVPWGCELFTAPDGSVLFTRSPTTVYRALSADLEASDAVTLTGERLVVAKQALQAALHFEEAIQPRDIAMMQALNATGSELRCLRAMKREFLGRTRKTRGAAIDIDRVVRDWRMLTDRAPLVDADGCTWMPHTLGYYGLVPACPQHPREQAGRDWRCNECCAWGTTATAERVAKIARATKTDPRLLAVQALQRVHRFATAAGVVRALQRAGVRGTPALQ